MNAEFDITPKAIIVPTQPNWGCNIATLSVSEQNTNNVEGLRELEREFYVRVRLDSINIHNNKWMNSLMQQIYEKSYPLRSIIDNCNVSREWLVFWEIYSKYFTPQLIAKLQKRAGSSARIANRLKGTPLRSFHSHDNDSSSINSLQKAISRVELEAGSQINWEWLATYTSLDIQEIAKNKSRWIKGVDGEGATTVANMRAWRNKIITSLKSVELIVSCNKNEEEIPSEIAFALINLGIGGGAIILIPRIASTAIVSMIHLFSHCFESTKIAHTMALDYMFLCGQSFLGNLTGKHHKMLYEFCDKYPGSPNISPFTAQYMSTDFFTDTVDKLVNVNNVIQEWRFAYYEKLLSTYSKLYKGAAAKSFENYVDNVLDDTYSDESEKWAIDTGFTFVSK